MTCDFSGSLDNIETKNYIKEQEEYCYNNICSFL